MAIPTASPKPEITEYGNKVLSAKWMLAKFATRRRIHNGLISGQSVNAYSKKAAHRQA